jgi:hypothetical protein
MVRVDVEVHIAYGVLVPLLDHTLQEDGHGTQLLSDILYIELVV